MKTDANINSFMIAALIKPATQPKLDGENHGIAPDNNSKPGKAGKAFAETLKDKIAPQADDSQEKQEADSGEEIPMDASINPAAVTIASEQAIPRARKQPTRQSNNCCRKFPMNPAS